MARAAERMKAWCYPRIVIHVLAYEDRSGTGTGLLVHWYKKVNEPAGFVSDCKAPAGAGAVYQREGLTRSRAPLLLSVSR